MTWRNRLRLVQSKAAAAYNFYSSTEDVLGISRDPKGIRTLFQHPWTGNFIFYVWQVQELLKGLEILINIGGGSDPYAGWGFTTSLPHLERIPIFDPSTGQTLFFKTILTTPDVVKAKLASSTERAAFLALLKTDPLFRPDPEILCTATEGADFAKGQVKDYVNELNYGKGESEEVQNVWITDWLLAKAFPARTGPLGSRENVAWGLKNNFNMTSDKFMTDPAKWPEQRKMINKETKKMEPVWWHTDYEDVAYLHVWKLYQKIVDLSKE